MGWRDGIKRSSRQHRPKTLECELCESGQAYGCMLDAPKPHHRPVLIAATATNGAEGYVLKSDLDRATGRSKSDAEIASGHSARLSEFATPYETP